MTRQQVGEDEPLDTHYDLNLDPDEEELLQHEPVHVDAVVREQSAVPIIPPQWHGWRNIKATVRAGFGYYGYIVAVHLVRSPKYAMLVGFWAVVGAGKLTWRFTRWVGDLDGRPSRDELAADSLDAWRRAREDHHAHVKHRLIGLVVGAVVLAIAGSLLYWLAPWWAQLLTAAVVVPTLAAVGKPAHRHIVTPAVVTPRVRRLNGDIVLRAYYAAGLGHPDKPNQQIMFGSPMARDTSNMGSHVAVDLPYGKGFRDALKQREAIASGLDVSVPQVFLSRDPTSNRRHQLFVADRDPLAIPAGRTPLLRLQPTDIWTPAPFGLDERSRKVEVDLMWNSILVGAQPRKGKTWSARLLALHAALDPYVRITLVDGKGSPDWRGFTAVADRTIFGLNLTRDGDPVEMLIATLRDILTDARSRYERLSALPTERVPEGKLTRDLARDKALGMPVHLLILEEIQEYLETPDQKANVEIGTMLNSIVKVAPASGVIVLTSTQKPAGIGAGDVARLFNGYRDNHSTRFALRCANRHVSDAVLGGDAYSEGFDASSIPVGKEYRGVGILYGASDDTPLVRTHYADGGDAEKILTTARRLRMSAGTLTGMAAGDDIRPDTRDPLNDVIRVFAFVDRPALHWRQLAAELATRLPDKYGQEDAESVSALLRGLGVESEVVSVDGDKQRGCKREKVAAVAEQRRQLENGGGVLVPVTPPRPR